MTPIKLLSVLATLLFGSGCATTGANPKPYCPPPDPRAPCAGWEPIMLHGKDVDVIDIRTARAIEAHDEHGVAAGCWKAK